MSSENHMKFQVVSTLKGLGYRGNFKHELITTQLIDLSIEI